MYRLAKLGFTQSYTYFAWRNAKWEIEQYMWELTRTEVAEFFRPNFWPNTPDILTEYLQLGGRPAFISRFVLAATLSSNYGIYGPAFELMANQPLHPGKEEYMDSEKYEVRAWNLEDATSLKPLITRVNRARRENAAFHGNESLQFHPVSNDQLIAYSKHTADLSNIVLMVVNLDHRWTQSGILTLPLEQFQIAADEPFELHDVLSGQRYIWTGPRNYVELRPSDLNAHLFRIVRTPRPERPL
jgi:starch synthase (maltosyl-transferring)